LVISSLGSGFPNTFGFAPCAEPYNHDQVSVPEDPGKVLLQQGRVANSVPTLIGFNRHEGMLMLASYIFHYLLPRAKDTLKNPDYFFSVDFCANMFKTRDIYTCERYKRKYLPNLEKGMTDFIALLPGLIRGFGDVLVKEPVMTFASANSRSSPTYLFSFDYVSQRGLNMSRLPAFLPKMFVDTLYTKHKIFGVTHADEVLYLYPNLATGKTEEELRASLALVRTLVSFAWNGNPGVGAQPMDETRRPAPYLSIQTEAKPQNRDILNFEESTLLH